MRKSVLFILIVSLISFFFIASTSIAAPKRLKFASYISADHPVNLSFTWFAKEFERRTDGRYKVETYYSGALGKAQELVDLCSTGAADAIFCAVGYTPDKFVLTRGFESIYVTENPLAWGKAIWDMYNSFPPLKEEWEKKNNLIFAFFSGMDNNSIIAKKPINDVQGLKGMKLRSYAAIGKMVKLLGAEPVSIAYPETYDAIHRGVIDGGTGIGYLSALASKLWEVAPYIVNPGCGVYGLTFTAISKKTYDNLPAGDRQIMDEVRKDAAEKHIEFMIEEQKKITETFLKKGVKLINWSKESKLAARKICVPAVWDDWLDEAKKKGLPADEFFDTYKSAIKKWESDPTCSQYEDPFDYFTKM